MAYYPVAQFKSHLKEDRITKECTEWNILTERMEIVHSYRKNGNVQLFNENCQMNGKERDPN